MDERLHKNEWAVRTIELNTAQLLVAQHHYAHGGANTATYVHGLFRVDAFWEAECVGVAWWIPPTRTAANATYPANWQGVLALSRLAIAPAVPKNACTFLLARSRRLIDRQLWPCLVTYADSWRGHTGAIYRADNWIYMGMTRPEAIYVLDGRMVARKAGPKTRTHADMIALGAECVGRFAKHKYMRLS